MAASGLARALQRARVFWHAPSSSRSRSTRTSSTRAGAGVRLLGRTATTWRERSGAAPGLASSPRITPSRAGAGARLLGGAATTWGERRGAGPDLRERAAKLWNGLASSQHSLRCSSVRFFDRAARIWRGPPPPARPTPLAPEPLPPAPERLLEEEIAAAIQDPLLPSESKLMTRKIDGLNGSIFSQWGSGDWSSSNSVNKEVHAFIITCVCLKLKEFAEKSLDKWCKQESEESNSNIWEDADDAWWFSNVPPW